MFNLNIPPSSLLGVDGSGGLCSKPNTPEILNSLIAMTNPLDNYIYNNIHDSNNNNNNNNNNISYFSPSSGTSNTSNTSSRNFNANAQYISQDSSHSTSSSSTSPHLEGVGGQYGTSTTPTVQQTCSQLIKAGLKLSIQSKRKSSTCEAYNQLESGSVNSGRSGNSRNMTSKSGSGSASGSTSGSGSDQPTAKSRRLQSNSNSNSNSNNNNRNYNNVKNNNNNTNDNNNNRNNYVVQDFEETTDEESEEQKTFTSTSANTKGLTPEDEDRRRRRRERNKIAATKCRMKKRERTQNLIKESEQLDLQNVELKSQVQALENERRKLLDMLQSHEPACLHPDGLNLPLKLLQSPAYKYLLELNLNENAMAQSDAGQEESMTSTTSIDLGSFSNGVGEESAVAPSTVAVSLPPQRTAIPPMSTIKFSRSNGFKAAAAAAAANASLVLPHQHQHQQHQLPLSIPLPTTTLPNGYCKPSPTGQELGYLNSPTQDSIASCLSSNSLCTATVQQHLTTCGNGAATPLAGDQSDLDGSPIHCSNNSLGIGCRPTLSDYIPNCDGSNLTGLTLTPTPIACSTPNNVCSNNSSNMIVTVCGSSGGRNGNSCVIGGTNSNNTLSGGDTSALLSGVGSPLNAVLHNSRGNLNCNVNLNLNGNVNLNGCNGIDNGSEGGNNNNISGNVGVLRGGNVNSNNQIDNKLSSSMDYVKNELIDSQSPYTTAQSAERFLFENNCDSFVDIKHAVSVHQPIENGGHGGPTLLQSTQLGGNLLDFTNSMMGGMTGCGITGGGGNNGMNGNICGVNDSYGGILNGLCNGSGIVPFHEQISIKNDYLQEVDLFAQLTAEEAEFVDLDSGVAAAFMANGGCLA